MKVFLSVFFAIIAAGLVLYLINILTIDTQLKVADDAATRFIESKKVEQQKEIEKKQEEQKKREEEDEKWMAFDACNKKAEDTLDVSIRLENVVRNTKSFVAFNVRDKAGNLTHYRCILDSQFKISSFEKH